MNPEDLEIPILADKLGTPQSQFSNSKRRRRSWLCFWASRDDPEASAAAPPSKILGSKNLLDSDWFECLTMTCCALAAVSLVYFLSRGTDMSFDKPLIRLDSVYVCPVNTTPNNNNSSSSYFVIWDLKFDITNKDNHTLCIPQFEVSVFSSYNRTSPLPLPPPKAAVTPTHTCVGSTNHTSALALLELEPEEDSFQTNGTTFRFDLKVHAQFYFRYKDIHFPYVADFICKDAEVVASSSSSCGSLVGGHPFHCYYESYELGGD